MKNGSMHVDGDFAFYRFVWDGIEDGWVFACCRRYMVSRIASLGGKPSAFELKQIRAHWERLSTKSVSQMKSLVGSSHYVLGKWTMPVAREVCAKLLQEGCDAVLVEVPDYSIANLRTGETAQIRSDELYDEVIDALLKNNAVVVSLPAQRGGGLSVD